MALYRGDLLDGLDVRDSAFDEWLTIERQRLRDLARDGLARLLARHMTSAAHDQAGAVARRLLALDPLREVAHRALMQIYAEQGQTTLALKQYQLCRDRLEGELGVKPEPETEQLYRSIKEKRAMTRRARGQELAVAANSKSGTVIASSSRTKNQQAELPSIAVLPFIDMGGDFGGDHLGDGVAEDIITGLSRFRGLIVIARDFISGIPG